MGLPEITASAISLIQLAWVWLGAQGPTAQPGAVLLLAWLVPWVLRTVVPEQWEAVTDWTTARASRVIGPALALRFRKAVQAVPSLATGVAVAVLVSGGDVAEALRVELYAVFAPLVHETLKAYRGGRPPTTGAP